MLSSTKLTFDLNVLKAHPAFPLAEHIINRLNSQGFKGYFAGGCVRDALLSRSPNDLDIATNATPVQVEGLFEKTVATGKEFGVIRVLGQNIEVEVATFRVEKDYVDGRHPTTVEWSSEKEDALRRDFTVNALFYDLKNHEVIDFVGGMSDLENGLLKTVGLPEERFFEDHLRILRAIRFTFEFDFSLDLATQEAVKINVNLLKTVSRERVRDEIQKIHRGPRPLQCFAKAEEWGFWQALFGVSKSHFSENLGFEAFFKTLSGNEKWSLFFHFLTYQMTPEVMDRISLSRIEQKEVLSFAKYQSDVDKWRQAKLADQLLEVKSLSFQLFLRWHTENPSVDQNWAASLLSEINRRNLISQFPEPLFRGEDIQTLGLNGPKLGQVLHEAYGQQLENEWTSKDQGIEWLKNYVDSIK